MQGNRDFTNEYLKHIDKATNIQSVDDTILAKTFLSLREIVF